MNYRALDKAKIKELLESLAWDGGNLTVYTERTISSENPYVIIGSSRFQPNSSSDTVLDTATYDQLYFYEIRLVWQATDNHGESELAEESIDEIESLIIEKLISKEVRNSPANWEDLVLTAVDGASFGDQDQLFLPSNFFIKKFQLYVQRTVQFN